MNEDLATARRFFARNMGQAMRLLARAYGKDAIIVSTRNVEGGVELYGLPSAKLSAPKTLTERRRASVLRRRQLGGQSAQDSLVEHPDSRRMVHGSNTNERPTVPDQAVPAGRVQSIAIETLYGSAMDSEQKTPQSAAHDAGLEGFAFEDADLANDSVDIRFNMTPDHRSDSHEVESEDFASADINTWLAPPSEEANSEAGSSDSALLHEAAPSRRLRPRETSIELLRAEVAELKRRLLAQEQFLQDRQVPAGADNFRAEYPDAEPSPRSELAAMGISENVIDRLYATAELNEINESTSGALLAFKNVLPVVNLASVDEGIYVATGGRRGDQLGLLAKFALYLSCIKKVENLVILSTTQNEHYLRRFSGLTKISVHSYSAESLSTTLLELAHYSHVLVDVGFAGIANGGTLDDQQELAHLRSLDLGHHEILGLDVAADPGWIAGQIDYWKNERTLFCLLNELSSCRNVGGLLSLLVEKSLPLAGQVDAEVLPESIKATSRGELMGLMSQNAQSADKIIPIVS